MAFSDEKRQQFERKDHSKKGEIDRDILSLVGFINSSPRFYTTSSCSGRITLFLQPKTGRKCDSEWLYTTHEKAESERIQSALEMPPPEKVWLRMESFIVHICAESLDDAAMLLDTAHEAGLKHSGIISLGKRIVVEITGSEHMDVLVSMDKDMLVPGKILEAFVDEANLKLGRNRQKIDEFLSILKEKFKY